jgi:hypothetical protein
MSPNDQQADTPRARGVEIVVTRIPKDGAIRVRFLEDPHGTHLHYMGKLFKPCLGDECDTAIHRRPIDWRGFAAVQMLQTSPTPAWVPTVLEITDRLRLYLGEETLRGTIWNLWRRTNQRQRQEFYGEKIDDIHPSLIPPAFKTRRAVERMYKVSPMLWDLKPLFDDPEIVQVTEINTAKPLQIAGAADGVFTFVPPRSGMKMEEMSREFAKQKAAWEAARQPEKWGA